MNRKATSGRIPRRWASTRIKMNAPCTDAVASRRISVETETAPEPTANLRRPAESTALAILLALSFSHLLNDLIQSLIPAIYPLLKESFDLTFTQVGLITLTFQMTASLL